MGKVTKNWRKKFSIKSLLKTKKKPRQTTFCYCPVCKSELISTNSYVGHSEFVRFKCTNCKTESKWIFDTPVPLRLQSDIEKLLKLCECINIEIDSGMSSIDNREIVLYNIQSINEKLKLMKNIIDKY